MLDYLTKLDFSDNEIIVLEDPSYEETHMVVRDVAIRVAKAKTEGRRLLTFWYYGGHGTQENTVRSLHNTDTGRYQYRLEENLRSLAKGSSAYVIGLFDCCREQTVRSGPIQRTVIRASGARGAGALPARGNGDKDENLILAFGCPPSKMTDADSTLVKDFFDFLLGDADAEGNIALPGNLNFFKTEDRKNETLIKVT